jgi:hypothetical protein
MKLGLPLCFHSPWRKHCVSEALYQECSKGLAHPDFAHRACVCSEIPVGPEGLTLHLVLKHVYYDAIDRGDKDVEYRNNTDYWRKRIMTNWNSNGGNILIFHRGYTKTTMAFRIKMPVFNGDQIELHLGERLS